MVLTDLRETELVEVAVQTKGSSASLDNWRPSALSALAMWFPGLFKDLAAFFNKVEETGKWPDRILTAYTSLIPKDLSLQDPAWSNRLQADNRLERSLPLMGQGKNA